TNWEVMPMIYAIAAGPQQQFSFGATLRYDENFFVGAAYRGHSASTGDALVLSGGLNLSEKVTLAYAFDLTLSDLQTVQDGSHEITIKYNLRQRIGAGIPPPRIFHPRAKE
ncbi:MAG: type IX secretion system membrane protein PorP/SprF, partial [Bacteroidota bacterium]